MHAFQTPLSEQMMRARQAELVRSPHRRDDAGRRVLARWLPRRAPRATRSS